MIYTTNATDICVTHKRELVPSSMARCARWPWRCSSRRRQHSLTPTDSHAPHERMIQPATVLRHDHPRLAPYIRYRAAHDLASPRTTWSAMHSPAYCANYSLKCDAIPMMHQYRSLPSHCMSQRIACSRSHDTAGHRHAHARHSHSHSHIALARICTCTTSLTASPSPHPCDRVLEADFPAVAFVPPESIAHLID